jgi:hexosaminidase
LWPEFNPGDGGWLITATSEESNLEIRYTNDGKIPGPNSPLYREPISFPAAGRVLAQAFSAGEPYGAVAQIELFHHLAKGKPVVLSHPWSSRYPGGGQYGLVNGVRGSNHYQDGHWQGFEGVDLEAVVDLGALVAVQRITVGFLQDVSRWIFLPTSIEMAISSDGQDFTVLGHPKPLHPPTEVAEIRQDFCLDFPPTSTRWVRIRASNLGVCPADHPGAGGAAWLFVDEISVAGP